jgi:DNA-3-methyladenine glycosylase
VSPSRPGRPPPAFPRSLLAADSLSAARSLLGARLVRDPDPGLAPDDPLAQRRVGRIVEVEAYIGLEDRASHARMGPTDRNRVMFGEPGLAYVYLVYGMHHCLNVVTGPAGFPAAVLVRSIVPIEGAAAMRRARVARAVTQRATGRRDPARAEARLARIPDIELAIGPANVTAALGVARSDTGLDLLDPRSFLRLEPRPGDEPEPERVATPRIGIAYAGPEWADKPWRLVDPSSPAARRRAP